MRSSLDRFLVPTLSPSLCRSIKSSAQENEPTPGKLSTRGHKDRGENWFIIGERRAIVVFSVRDAPMWTEVGSNSSDVSLGCLMLRLNGGGRKELNCLE